MACRSASAGPGGSARPAASACHQLAVHHVPDGVCQEAAPLLLQWWNESRRSKHKSHATWTEGGMACRLHPHCTAAGMAAGGALCRWRWAQPSCASKEADRWSPHTCQLKFHSFTSEFPEVTESQLMWAAEQWIQGLGPGTFKRLPHLKETAWRIEVGGSVRSCRPSVRPAAWQLGDAAGCGSAAPCPPGPAEQHELHTNLRV